MAISKQMGLFDRVLLALLWLFFLFALVLGGQMLITPMGWYEATPGVSETGPFNPHFIRDVGIAFIAGAFALGYGLLKPLYRRPLFLVALIFFGGHAIMHAVEMLHGHAHDGVVGEMIAIILPAIIMTIVLFRTKSKGTFS